MVKPRPMMSPDPDATALRWPRSRLDQALADQLAQGDKIASALAAASNTWVEPDKSAIATEVEKVAGVTPDRWHERNRTILRQAFTTTQVLDEYDPSARVRRGSILSSAINAARSDLQLMRLAHTQRLGQLLGVAERVDLYADPAAPGAGEDAVELMEVFVVHGRDNATKTEVARALHQLLGQEPVILHEQPDGGATIIEKLEHHANLAAVAVVILSPDDVGGLAGDNPQLRHRARQNVVLELGMFWGKLGRGQVIALMVDDVEQPSDMAGVLYIPVDDAGAWRYKLGKELQHAGLDVDLYKLP